MTTNHKPGDEITGDVIAPGDVIGVRDRSVYGYHTDQYLAIIVEFVTPINDMLRYVHGIVIIADDTWIDTERTIITVANAEPIDYYGDTVQVHTPWRDNSGNTVAFARGLVTAIRATRREV